MLSKTANCIITVWVGIGLCIFPMEVFGDITPMDIQFTRQAVRRMVFDPAQEILLWSLRPEEIVGLEAMYPSVTLGDSDPARYVLEKRLLTVKADKPSRSTLWMGGMNPFAGYVLDIDSLGGQGMMGFDFAAPEGTDCLSVMLMFKDAKPVSISGIIRRQGKEVLRQVIYTAGESAPSLPFQFRLQMLGAGLTAFIQKDGDLPVAVGHLDFNAHLDLRRKEAFHTFQTRLLTDLNAGSEVSIRQARSVIDTGIGLADMRAITLRDGRPYLDKDRLWFTMSIRGRALPHHIQGVLSVNPSVFDLKLEGIILFDRGDGLLRNEIASHIFYDEQEKQWHGVTTGFSAFANPQEKKELWAVQSRKDPRFGISIMQAAPMNLVGDYEDAHILFDAAMKKWRMLVCENHGGYKAVLRQSDRWDGGYERISGPVEVDSTGTMIQKIGGKRYCLFGSAARQLFVYSYPELIPLGQLKMDLPPWSTTSGTRIWANLVPLPEGYPSRYLLLTMDRFNFPGIKGPNWSYGALYLYHGYAPDGDVCPYEYDNAQ
jgi:hypothetical protein